MTKGSLGYVRNIASNLFWTKLGFTDFYIKVADINTSQSIVFDKFAGNNDRVIHVETMPWHEGNKHVLAKRELTVIDRCTFDKDVTLLNFLTTFNYTMLIITAIIVSLFEVAEFVLFDFFAIFNFNNIRIGLCNFTISFSEDNLRKILYDLGVNTSRNASSLSFN